MKKLTDGLNTDDILCAVAHASTASATKRALEACEDFNKYFIEIIDVDKLVGEFDDLIHDKTRHGFHIISALCLIFYKYKRFDVLKDYIMNFTFNTPERYFANYLIQDDPNGLLVDKSKLQAVIEEVLKNFKKSNTSKSYRWLLNGETVVLNSGKSVWKRQGDAVSAMKNHLEDYEVRGDYKKIVSKDDIYNGMINSGVLVLKTYE